MLTAFALARAEAGIIYVSTQGSDSNPGTSTQPFRTITHAYGVATAGTTILVAPGLYTDYTSGWGIHLGKSGTASSPIVLRSQTPGAAVIDGLNASDRNVCFYIDGNYNMVDGFEIKNGPKGAITIWANYNSILNCNIHNNGNQPNSSTQGRDGVYSSEGTSGNRYSRNIIRDNGRAGSNLDHGLYLCGQNELVNNNVIVGNTACGVQVAGYTTVSNLKIYNNVIAFNGTEGIILWQALSGVDIRNNIIYRNGHWGVGSWDAHGSGVVVDQNLSCGNGSGNFNFRDGGSDVSYSLGTTSYNDPKLVNVSSTTSFDGHLQSDSPAIRMGANLSSYFTVDKDGTARAASGPWDLGAYVYGSTSTGGTGGSTGSTGTGTTTNSGSGTTLPIVTVTAPVPKAVIGSTSFGVITFHRTGSTASPLTVNYSLTGTAVKWDDYRRAGSGDMPLAIAIPAGASSYSMSIWAVGNETHASPEYFTLTLSATSSYQVGSPNSATMTLVTGGVASTGTSTNPDVLVDISKSDNGMTLTWNSVPGTTYRVGFKSTLNDPHWTDLSNDLIAADAATSWTDLTSGAATQRYYAVYAAS